MNTELARTNMINYQLRAWHVLDDGVLDLFNTLTRDAFVPEAFRELAYSDIEIPLGHGQFMLKPKEEARMIQALAIQPSDKILEVGTGSGYTTALLANKGYHVFSAEIIPELSDQALRKLAAHNILNVSLEVCDAANGWADHANYDVIAITGSLPYLPDDFKQELTIGGRLFAFIGAAPSMHATLITRTGETTWETTTLYETVVPPLVNAPTPTGFVF